VTVVDGGRSSRSKPCIESEWRPAVTGPVICTVLPFIATSSSVIEELVAWLIAATH